MARLKSAFLANMSHEIRTPLTTIIGFAQLLAQEVPEHREFTDMIERSGKRLMDTLNSVLDLAQLESGKVTLHLQTTNLVKAVKEAVALLQPLAEKKQLMLQVRATTPTISVALDHAAFHRVLNNLVGNALKFTQEGGIFVEVRIHEKHAHIRIRDTGQGISAEFLPHLFDDFRQESSGHGRMHEGNGLGLSITKRLVNLMHGTIAVESRQDQGSTFTVTFPLATEPASLSPNDAPPPTSSPEMSSRRTLPSKTFSVASSP